MDHQPEPLLTVEELAAFLRVPRSWIYEKTRTAHRTGFPVVRAGKYCRFNREKVLEWLNGKSSGYE
jgi:excisionase family DNA binding protein